MKRDMDLIRAILFAVEAVPEGELPPNPFRLPGYSDEVVAYHVHLMGEAGLLDVYDITELSHTLPQAMPARITWAGHDFADTVREQAVWNQTKEALKAGGSGAFGLVLSLAKQLAERYAKQKIKEQTGIDLGG